MKEDNDSDFSEKEILQEIYTKVDSIETMMVESKKSVPKEPIKEAVRVLDKKTEKTFTDEDLKGSLILADKALELAFKKMKSLRGGEHK